MSARLALMRCRAARKARVSHGIQHELPSARMRRRSSCWLASLAGPLKRSYIRSRMTAAGSTSRHNLNQRESGVSRLTASRARSSAARVAVAAAVVKWSNSVTPGPRMGHGRKLPPSSPTRLGLDATAPDGTKGCYATEWGIRRQFRRLNIVRSHCVKTAALFGAAVVVLLLDAIASVRIGRSEL